MWFLLLFNAHGSYYQGKKLLSQTQKDNSQCISFVKIGIWKIHKITNGLNSRRVKLFKHLKPFDKLKTLPTFKFDNWTLKKDPGLVHARSLIWKGKKKWIISFFYDHCSESRFFYKSICIYFKYFKVSNVTIFIIVVDKKKVYRDHAEAHTKAKNASWVGYKPDHLGSG